MKAQLLEEEVVMVMVVDGDGDGGEDNDSGNANDDDHNQQEEEDAAAAAMMNSDKAAEVKKVEVVVDPVQANKSKEQVRFLLQWGNFGFPFFPAHDLELLYKNMSTRTD